MTDKVSHAYIGIKPCGCVVAAVVDDGKYPKDTAESVARFIKDGLTVERVRWDEVKTRFTGCKCEKEEGLFHD